MGWQVDQILINYILYSPAQVFQKRVPNKIVTFDKTGSSPSLATLTAVTKKNRKK